MADSSDQALKIQIILDLIGQGKVDEAKTQLEGLKKSSSELTAATKDSANATSASTGETNKLADATKGLDLKKRELLESMHLLTAQAPILGEVMRVMFNPATAAIFGILGAFELLHTRIENLENSLGALELPNLSDGIRQAEDAATGYDDLAQSVQDADTAFNSVEETQKRTLVAINDQIAAQKLLLAAEKNLEERRLDQQRATGQITPAQYAASRAAIEQGYNDKTVQMEIDARNAQLAEKQKAVQGFGAEALSYQAKADAITKNAGIGKTDAEFEAQKKAYEDIITARQKEIDEARKNLEMINRASSPNAMESLAATPSYVAHYGVAPFADAQKLEQDRITENEQEQKDIEKRMGQMDEAKKKRDDLHKKSLEDAGKYETGVQELQGQDDPNKVGSVAWQNAQAQRTMSVQDQATGVQRDTDLQTQFKSDAEFIQRASGERMTPELAQKAAATIRDLQGLMKDHLELGKAIVGLNIPQIKADIQNVTQQLKQQGQQIASVQSTGNR